MQEILDNAQIFNGVDHSSQCDDARFMKRRPAWKTDVLNPLKIEPQSDLTVTDVSHAYQLEKVKALSAIPSELQTSEEWLQNHSISFQKLTLKDLLSKGKQVKRPGSDTHMVFSGTVINEMEYKLNSAIELYHDRIKWLLGGTRATYGLIKGDRVGVLIDSSDANTGFGRLKEFQKSLLDLIDEQLSTKKSLYFLSFGTDVESLWNIPRDVNTRILEEARDFVRQIRPSGGCNLLKAFKKIMKVKRLNSVVIILGTCPDQTSNVLFDYVEQCLLGKELPIQAIAYDNSNHHTHTTLQKLSNASRGRYQCYSSSDIKESYKSSDVRLLLRESQRTLDMLSKIKQMRSGMLGNALISIENEIALEVEHLSLSRFLPRPVNHHQPLNIEKANFHPTGSSQWLAENGLRAKQLNLYQVLAQDAFDPIRDFVPILRKSVRSRVNETAMQQFEWHDGSVKNMHVDVAMLYDYQKKLGNAVQNFETRIEWLASASRRIWGTICEKRVILLIDTSIGNRQYLVHLQHSIRLVLEQQMLNKEAFNLIAFGSNPKMWKPHMVKPTKENLQSAWRWALHLEANGSRNFMGAFRTAVENMDDIKCGGVQGIYCIGSGIPDQQEDVARTFVSEKCIGCDLKLHVILFCIDDYQQESELPSRYANLTRTSDYLRNLAHAGHGRFHWFRESGIIESDDISAIMREMERAVYFSQRCATLVNSVKANKGSGGEDLKAIEPRRKKVLMPPPLDNPRQTALSIAREQRAIRGETQKCLAWRAPTIKATLPGVPYKQSKSNKKSKESTKGKVAVEPFYTEEKGNVGTVFKKFPKKKSVRKSIPEPILPEMEERVSSKQWLKRYGINKMKLNLERFVSGPVCVHDKAKVRSTGGQIHAKWFCSIFPSVDVNDKVRHIDMNIQEIDDYEFQLSRLTKRYLQRMQWMLSGSRKAFGVVLENRVLVLIDVSGSMDFQLNNLKSELKNLIWEQLYKHNIAFNIIAFSDHIASWQDETTPAEDATCNDAVQWVSSLHAHGGTKTLEALEEAFSDKTADAIYLLSDGKPDTSIKLTLEAAGRANKKHIPIHTISYNCDDNAHTMFMSNLAHQSGGRFHYCGKGERDAHLAAYKMMTEGFGDEDDPNLPEFRGDDLQLMRKEVTKARKYVSQARLYKRIVEQHKEESQQQQRPNSASPQPKSKFVSEKPFLP
uniref:von Willebrand factor A domain-containing protein 3A-like n=1 Tax=Styela clava TaxID=7725 RepID=UPI00193A8CF8|nr:von Willebrand factor A domain-containing protein 3A-like [Styela clava]